MLLSDPGLKVYFAYWNIESNNSIILILRSTGYVESYILLFLLINLGFVNRVNGATSKWVLSVVNKKQSTRAVISILK